jgi:hypothetical protein
MIYILALPSLLETKAIFLPSGDHFGFPLSIVSKTLVNLLTLPVSRFIVKISNPGSSSTRESHTSIPPISEGAKVWVGSGVGNEKVATGVVGRRVGKGIDREVGVAITDRS